MRTAHMWYAKSGTTGTDKFEPKCGIEREKHLVLVCILSPCQMLSVPDTIVLSHTGHQIHVRTIFFSFFFVEEISYSLQNKKGNMLWLIIRLT